MSRRFCVAIFAVCLFPLPASAQSLRTAVATIPVPESTQHSPERQSTERKAFFFFWSGVSVAAAGLLPTMAGASSVGLPMMAGGGALIYYGVHLNQKAKRMPAIGFGAVPLKKGFAVGVTRSW